MSGVEIHQCFQPFRHIADDDPASTRPAFDRRLVPVGPPTKLTLAPTEDSEADQQAMGGHHRGGRIGVFILNTRGRFRSKRRQGSVFKMNTSTRHRWTRGVELRLGITDRVGDIVHKVQLQGVFHAPSVDGADANGVRVSMRN